MIGKSKLCGGGLHKELFQTTGCKDGQVATGFLTDDAEGVWYAARQEDSGTGRDRTNVAIKPEFVYCLGHMDD